MSERLVRQAVRPFRRTRHIEDLEQVARLALWQHADADEALRVTIARRRVIDAHRQWTHERHDRRRVSVLPFAPDSPVLDSECIDLTDDGWCPMFANDRLDYIARRMAEGAQKQTIAAELGVTPSMVSRLLAQMRSMITA